MRDMLLHPVYLLQDLRFLVEIAGQLSLLLRKAIVIIYLVILLAVTFRLEEVFYLLRDVADFVRQ